MDFYEATTCDDEAMWRCAQAMQNKRMDKNDCPGWRLSKGYANDENGLKLMRR